MKKTVIKAALAGLAVCAALPIAFNETNAQMIKSSQETVTTSVSSASTLDSKKKEKKADLEKDGYRIIFVDKTAKNSDEAIHYGDELRDYEAPGFPVNDAVYFYTGKVYSPEVKVYEIDGRGNILDKKEAIPSKYYDVQVPEGRKELGYYTYKVTFKGKYAKYGTVSKSIFIEANNSVTNVKAKGVKNGIKVTWKPFTTQYANRFVTGYSVSYAKWSDIEKMAWVNFTKNRTIVGKSKKGLTVRNLNADTEYGVMVRPYFKINNKKIYGNWSKVVKAKTSK